MMMNKAMVLTQNEWSCDDKQYGPCAEPVSIFCWVSFSFTTCRLQENADLWVVGLLEFCLPVGSEQKGLHIVGCDENLAAVREVDEVGHDVRRHIGQLDFLQLWRFVSLESFVGKQLSESTMYEIFPKQDAYIPANIRIHTRAHLHVFSLRKQLFIVLFASVGRIFLFMLWYDDDDVDDEKEKNKKYLYNAFVEQIQLALHK